MKKSKLGLPAGMVAAFMYLTGLFGGYVAAIIAAGFILLCEEENFIRRAAVKTLLVIFLCAILNAVIYLIPNIVEVFRSMLGIFRVYFSTEFLDNLTGMFAQSLSLLKTVFLILLAVLAVFGKSLDLKPINKLADK